MSILLMILKFAGIFLLALLCLFLLLLAAVLLAPVRYRVSGSFHEAPAGQVKLGWLFHALSGKAGYGDGKLTVDVRVFGVRVLRKELLGTAETAEDEQTETLSPDGEPHVSTEPEPVEKKRKRGPSAKKKETKKSSVDETGKTEPKPSGMESVAHEEAISEKMERAPSGGSLNRIRAAVSGIYAKGKGLAEKKDGILAFIQDEDNRNTFRLIRRQVFRLLRHILPYRADGYVRFGFDDPYTTGQILTYVSPFYALYAEHVILTPVFEEKVLDGELLLRGRIRVGTVLALGIRILLNKNFRRLIRRWKER